MTDGPGFRSLAGVVWLALVAGCAAPVAPGDGKAEEHAEYETTVQPLTVTERRQMLFEGSCEFLACCSKRNCSLPHADVIGACGTGCSDTVPWIARPNRDSRYTCGECVRVCLADTSNCVEAVVWDNSITTSAIEGNIALFDALGLAHSDSPRSCTGTGGAWVDVGPCTAPPPADDPPEPECTCSDACDYCWCGGDREEACEESWNGTGDGCDCGCQWSDPDCGGAPADPGGGGFAGVYCTDPGGWCGGNEPCWPHYDCPAGSTCDWAEGSWGRCVN